MAKKSEVIETPETPETVPGTKFAGLAKAKKISTVVDQWIGKSPAQFAEEYNLSPADILHVDFNDLLENEIIVVGFSERTGEKSPFLIILAVLVETDEAITACCGGQVVCKKLRAAGEKKALPVQGVISMPEGKNYFDFK